MREYTIQRVSRTLNINLNNLKQTEHEAVGNFATVLSLVPNISNWSKEEKELMSKILRAKGLGSEAKYLQLMQKHTRLREAFIKLAEWPLNFSS